MPMPVAARSKSLVCSLPLAAIVGSNSAGGMDILYLMSVVCWRSSLRRADHSCSGVLQSVLCPMIVVANLRKERPWPRIGSKRHRKKETYKNWVRSHGPNPATWGYCPVAGIFEHSNIPSVFIKSGEYYDELSDSPSSEGCVYCSHGQLNTFLGPMHQ
jgi:hypothetical protein